jgi:Xaa-Pro aminopeptidase
MVITVEPGLYIPADATTAPAHLRGIGIRIEDDVAITEGGNEVLTAECPKEVDDLEAACRWVR